MKTYYDNGYLGETILTDLQSTPFENYSQLDWVQYFLEESTYDGEHHKVWAIDQAIRVLKGTAVIIKLATWANGAYEYRVSLDQPSQQYLNWLETQENWDQGIAP